MTKRTRYFIHQPHHALSAMLDFGMEFEDKKGREINVSSMLGKCLARNIPDLVETDYQWPVYYIRPSSEKFLRVKEGDVVKIKRGLSVVRITITAWTRFNPDSDSNIIQRNGLPFPPIETEIVESAT